ncbi:Protein translocase subunit SecA [Durusdinium trenchii]|uniref:Protein translocase subunit SecA n=1 Tax=Durusdinium trenchii TaxID=1381693 RepID=A0ABP0HAJ2_9DINO
MHLRFYEAPEKQTQKRYEPQVQAKGAAFCDAINALEETMKAKSDDQLRALTADLQQRAQSGTPLEELLPEAFALVREGSTRVLGLRHFDVQLMGGIALHEGNIAEMGTGEAWPRAVWADVLFDSAAAAKSTSRGKTLVAILAAFLNALSGKGVHVVTVNDYLARRDAEWVGQPLRFLGMTVGVVQNGMPPDQKKKAYRNDVTYVTNSHQPAREGERGEAVTGCELGFDYLRDQMAPSPSELALREQTPFNFAVVDEVDSILIDEARTPLIISGVADNTPTKYKVAQEVVRALKPEARAFSQWGGHRKVHYTVDEKQRQCVLIEGGVEAAEKLLGKDDLFDPEDPWFPFVTNALNAKELYIKDKAYIVKRGEVMIVDEFTGRVMEGRRWSNGLHQAGQPS